LGATIAGGSALPGVELQSLAVPAPAAGIFLSSLVLLSVWHDGRGFMRERISPNIKMPKSDDRGLRRAWLNPCTGLGSNIYKNNSRTSDIFSAIANCELAAEATSP
jgi:hypothetical protein